MFTTRRHILALAGAPFIAKLFAEDFDVDRILQAGQGTASTVRSRRYVANAAFSLFSIPLGSKSGVGSGYTVIEETRGPSGSTVSIQFGAGSYPEAARGLNRLGFIQEAVSEQPSGLVDECAYLAFMTTSQERNVDQAKKALESSPDSPNTAGMVPYSAARGCARRGGFASRVDRLLFPSRFGWRDVQTLVRRAREAMAANGGLPENRAEPEGAERPATFLYALRKSLMDPHSRTTACLFFNGKHFQLDAAKESDPAAGAHFAARKLTPRAEGVMRLDALLTDRHTGERTSFRLWYEAGSEQMPPLRFEYQPRSFLRLTFEADAAVFVPPLCFAWAAPKENA